MIPLRPDETEPPVWVFWLTLATVFTIGAVCGWILRVILLPACP